MIDSTALIIGYGFMAACGLFGVAVLLFITTGVVYKAGQTFYNKALLGNYRLECLRYYMGVMTTLGRKGMLKHVDDAKKEAREKNDEE